MPVTKVAISLQPDLLARIDAAAAAGGQTRSAYMGAKLRAFLDAEEEERIVREARAIYQMIEGAPGAPLQEAFLESTLETLPPFDLDPATLSIRDHD